MLKKIGLMILSLMFTFVGLNEVNAANVTMNVKSSNSKVVVGNTFTVTVTVSSSVPLGSWEYNISYDSSRLKLQSGTPNIVDYGNGSKKSASYKYTFKALKSGSAKVSVKSYNAYSWDESKSSVSISSSTVKIITQEELIASYSKDNSLSSITIDGYSLTPAFNKETLEYVVNVPNTVEKINLNAKANDNSATISGLGEKEVSEGDNLFEIIVTAENGSERKYKVNIKVEDPNPIEVTTSDNQIGTIVKRASSLTKPSVYSESTVTINGEEIPSFTSDITGLTLVGIKVDDNVNLYIYDEENNTYTIYKEIQFNSSQIHPMEYNEYPKGYKKYEIKINDIDTYIYKYKKESNFGLLYAMNIETGEKELYQYDIKNNNIIKYNCEEIEDLNLMLDNFKFIILVLCGESILLLIILICVIAKKNKNKKIYKKFLKELKEKKEKNSDNKEVTKEEKIKDDKKSKKKNNKMKNDKKEEVVIEKMTIKDLEMTDIKSKKRLSDTQKLDNL